MTLKQNACFACKRPGVKNLSFMRAYEREVVFAKIRALGAEAFSAVELSRANPGLFNEARLARVLKDLYRGGWLSPTSGYSRWPRRAVYRTRHELPTAVAA